MWHSYFKEFIGLDSPIGSWYFSAQILQYRYRQTVDKTSYRYQRISNSGYLATFVSHVYFHFPRNIGVSPLGYFSWDATLNKHLPLRKSGSMKETLDARDEHKREDESSMCASLNIRISLSKSDWARIDARIVNPGAVGGLNLQGHQARRERGLDGLIKADGGTNRERIDNL